MTTRNILHALLQSAYLDSPCAPALIEPAETTVTYQELITLANKLRDRLCFHNIKPGDRVGLYLPKTIDAVAAVFGILQTGAAYIPVDSDAPIARNAYILSDCTVKAVIVDASVAPDLCSELARLDHNPLFFTVEEVGGGHGLRRMLAEKEDVDPAPVSTTIYPEADSLAYILYTSGSTGRPKGVMHTHRSATSFVNWCSELLQPVPEDRFSSHAPFHFDLSILDIFVPLKHGASLVLIDEATGKQPFALAPLIAEQKISIWYSTPSILNLLAQFGKLPRYNYDALRIVLFAGEVFPIKQLRRLTTHWPGPKYYNLYGPTETNVCTWHEVETPISPERGRPFPIGQACPHYRAIVVDGKIQKVEPGQEGELCVSGPAVMTAYWNLPERTAAAFLVDAAGDRWYKTGDIVQDLGGGVYDFIGRLDRMVKKRGYRVELGEVEAALYRHPAVQKAAVIAVSHDEMGLLLKAFLCCENGQRPSIIDLKSYYGRFLPAYMIPDIFSFQETLPQTSTGKTDYQQLTKL